jgi:hypothetical protein
MKKNRDVMIISFIAGLCLLLSGTSGFATWNTIQQFVTTYLINNLFLQIIFSIIIFIASLGGIAVILGGLLIGKNNVITGKFLIMLGAGMGLIGLIIACMIAIIQSNQILGGFFSIGTFGILLSIIARKKAKK